MTFTSLAWQLPAMFTAVPMLHRLLPFKLPERAYPLFYFLVCLVVMFLPGRIDLALGAAGLLSMIHIRLGEHLSHVEPPDMQEVANKAALAWDYIAVHLLSSRWPSLRRPGGKAPVSHDSPDDATPEDDTGYQEPPKVPDEPIARTIPHL